MKINIFSLFILLALPGWAPAAETVVLGVTGTVEARLTREGDWVPAAKDMEIAEGGGIRTGERSRALVQLPNKSKVWMKEKSALEIEQRKTLSSRLALIFGNIKVRVPHLMRKEKFELRTPTAICAVRGTEFTVDAPEGGKMDLQVLFGEVKFKFQVPQPRGKSEFNIPQGQGITTRDDGKPAAPALLTAKQEQAAMESWDPGLKPDERVAGLVQKENDRAQLKAFARATTSAENAIKNFLNVVKESDLEAGRTLKDVHGNTVRVDQRMMRPAADEIQFFNLVKRPSYANYTASSDGFAYNGGAVANRLDYMQMTMNFNQDLPQRIEEWPSFFNGNSVNADWASFVLANRTKADEIFFIAQGYEYDAARDELVNNTNVVNYGTLVDRNVIITGVLKDEAGVSAITGLGRITSLDIQDAGTLDGQLKYGDGTNVNGGSSDVIWAVMTNDAVGYSRPTDRPDNAPLAQYQADMYDIGAQGTGFLWFAKENYVIGNGGQIRTAGDFTNSSSDPFSLLKDNALETVMSVKKSVGNNSALITNSDLAKADIDTEDMFSYNGGAAGVGTNIDIVFIPDLMVAAVQRMLPAISNLSE